MVRRPAKRPRGGRVAGMTLMELMMSVVILGILFGVVPKVIIGTFQFFRLSIARSEIQRDARTSLDLMNRYLRQAEGSTIVVDRHNTSQPPYSRVTFDTPSVASMRFWQEGRKLKMKEGTEPDRLLADNLRYIAFTFGESDNANIMSVSVTFEKAVYSGKSKALQMAVEKVRIMN
jgi:prepilin-type N-terminal cleavage/methylation domain-containing protein